MTGESETNASLTEQFSQIVEEFSDLAYNVARRMLLIRKTPKTRFRKRSSPLTEPCRGSKVTQRYPPGFTGSWSTPV